MGTAVRTIETATACAWVAMGYVNHAGGATPEFIKSSRYEINIAGECVSATAHLRAPYDPERKKLLA